MTDTRIPPDPLQEVLIERLAKEIERATMADYGWTESQFDTWWTKDPVFTARACGRPGSPEPMTRKEHALWQLREGLSNSGLILAEEFGAAT
ncbi:hypothetical protein [Agrobacterium sp. CG674]